MKQFIKDNFFKIIILIPVICTILGTIIINLYLTTYNLTDFDILKAHTIYVGTIFIIHIFILVIYFCSFIDIYNIEKVNILYLIFFTAFKVILISVLYYSLFIRVYHEYKLFKRIITPDVILGFSTLFGTIWFLPVILYYEEIFQKRLKKIEKIAFTSAISTSSILIIIIFIILFKNEKLFRQVSLFFMYFGLGFIVINFSRLENIIKGFIIPNYQPSSPFSKVMSEKTRLLDIGFSIFWITILLMIIISTYSRIIYPSFPKTLSGGKSPYIEINHENNITKGKIIHATKDLMFLLIDEEEGRIKIIEWKDTDEIHAIKEE